MSLQIGSLRFQCETKTTTNDANNNISLHHLTAILNRHSPDDNPQTYSSYKPRDGRFYTLVLRLRKNSCLLSQLIFLVWHYEHSCAYRKLVLSALECALTQSPLMSNRIARIQCLQVPPNQSFNVALKLIISFNVDPDCDICTPIDKSWNLKILKYAHLRMEIEEGLSWLSTLGGAFSSLGDRNVYFARKAGQISLSQLRLSSVFGDPNLIARCFIYICHSLGQQGYRKKAIRLIKKILYPYLQRLDGSCERIVAQMYRSLRFRIYFIYK